MNLPFTSEQFLDVFRAYNQSVWPTQFVLNALALAAITLAIRVRSNGSRVIAFILAFLWLWMGGVYHLGYFTAINNAAYAFGLLFIIQGLIFLYAGIIQYSLSFRFRPDAYGITGALFILYALLLYPAFGFMLGHYYPDSPTFGLPCPTTIFTLGLLLWADKVVPWFVVVIPFIWSIIGFSAAFSLGIGEDIGLLIAGLTGSLLIYIRSKAGGRTESGQV